MIEGVDSTELGSTDTGADRETRIHVCSKHAWCTVAADHAGPCEVAPRTDMAPSDFGPRRSK